MTVRKITSLAAVLVATGLVLAQGEPKKGTPAKGPPKPAPGSLEDTLDKALRNSADIKAAEAKVRESEAALNQVRQQVLTRATALHADLNLAKRMLGMAQMALDEQEQLRKSNGVSRDAILAAQTMVEKHRGEVEKLETELKSLRGEFAIRDLPLVGMAFDPAGEKLVGSAADGTVRIWDVKDGTALSEHLVQQYLGAFRAARPAAPAVSGSMMDRVKKLLDQEVEFEVGGMKLEDALRELMGIAKSDIPIRAILNAVQAEARVELRQGKLPIGAWIQALEDSDDQVVVVVRDYGLLMTMKDRIPAGALRVHDLWKGNYVELKLKNPEKKK